MAASDILKEDKQLIDKKSSLLKSFIKDNLETTMQLDQEGHSLPQMPNIKVTKFIPEKCFIFKSAVMPMRMAFEAKNFKNDYQEELNEEPVNTEDYYAVYKNGDDLR